MKMTHDRKFAIIMRSLAVLCCCFLAFVPSNTVCGQEELSFVYGTNHYNGAAYNSAMIPPTIDTLYLIADHPNIVAGRFTHVYYWPLTDELKADWSMANIVVEGALEVWENRQLVETVELTNYVIQYDGLDKYGTIRLFLGEEAVQARQYYEEQQAQYREDLYEYYNRMDAYREKFQQGLADLQAGKITEDQLPEMPAEQKDFSLFSTELLIGYPLDLPAEKYTIQLRLPDGSVQPNSKKSLVVFEEIQEGIGYNIISEERWSVPEKSEETNEVIYSLMGKRVFFEAYHQKQYNQLYYIRLNNPQDNQARRDRTVWVPFAFADDVRLIFDSGVETGKIDLKDYHVNQLAGSALGYEVIEHSPDSTQNVTFSGFAVDVDTSTMDLYLVGPDNQPVPQSGRELRVLQTQRAWLIYVLSALPLLGGALLIIARRRSVSTRGPKTGIV